MTQDRDLSYTDGASFGFMWLGFCGVSVFLIVGYVAFFSN